MLRMQVLITQMALSIGDNGKYEMLYKPKTSGQETYPWPKQICWFIEDKALERLLEQREREGDPWRMHFVAKKICGILQQKYLKMPSIWDIELFFKAARTPSNSLKIPRCRTNFISYNAKPKN